MATKRNNGRNGGNAKPLLLTVRQVNMLLVASGNRLAHLMTVHTTGAITGAELGARIDAWKELIAKLSASVEHTRSEA